MPASTRCRAPRWATARPAGPTRTAPVRRRRSWSARRTAPFRKAIEVPGSGTLNAGRFGNVTMVSCDTAGNCAAGLTYTDDIGRQQAFVVSQTNGTWGNAMEIPGLGTLNAGGNASANSVSCGSAGDCAAGGFYRDSAGHPQASARPRRLVRARRVHLLLVGRDPPASYSRTQSARRCCRQFRVPTISRASQYEVYSDHAAGLADRLSPLIPAVEATRWPNTGTARAGAPRRCWRTARLDRGGQRLNIWAVSVFNGYVLRWDGSHHALGPGRPAAAAGLPRWSGQREHCPAGAAGKSIADGRTAAQGGGGGPVAGASPAFGMGPSDPGAQCPLSWILAIFGTTGWTSPATVASPMTCSAARRCPGAGRRRSAGSGGR